MEIGVFSANPSTGGYPKVLFISNHRHLLKWLALKQDSKCNRNWYANLTLRLENILTSSDWVGWGFSCFTFVVIVVVASAAVVFFCICISAKVDHGIETCQKKMILPDK